MAREYRHIKEYEKEILELKSQGKTHREIGEQLGFTKSQIKKFFERQHQKERKKAAETAIKRNGRPPKDDKCNKKDKVNELKKIIAQKDARIKTLEMENELIRDFLLLTERK